MPPSQLESLLLGIFSPQSSNAHLLQGSDLMMRLEAHTLPSFLLGVLLLVQIR